MTSDAPMGARTVPDCTHETSTQDLNLPCQACLLAERDRLRQVLVLCRDELGILGGYALVNSSVVAAIRQVLGDV